jgi:protein dithiol oxidoreductase (disulfide-forming)
MQIRFDRRSFLIAAAVAPALAAAQGKAGPPVESRDFRAVNPPVPVDGSKVEVLEFFQYSCPHCYSFTPALEAWKKKLAADVEYRRLPINWDASTVNHTKTYYALEQLNRVGDLHERFFAAIHVNKRRMLDAGEIADFMAANGIDKAKWNENFNSFSVNARVNRAGQIWRAHKIDGTPAVGIDGKWVTAPSMVGTLDGALAVMDFLVARARTERGRR